MWPQSVTYLVLFKILPRLARVVAFSTLEIFLCLVGIIMDFQELFPQKFHITHIAFKDFLLLPTIVNFHVVHHTPLLSERFSTIFTLKSLVNAMDTIFVPL